jgi:hypothetical protein
MKRTRRYLLFLLAAVAIAVLGVATTSSAEEGPEPVAHTDGHLRPGHFETIWVKRFPGRGRLEVSFFPTAICEAECGSVGRWGGFTSRKGRAKFRVRVPQTFINQEGKRVPYRNHERINLLVTWEEPKNEEFTAAEAEPEPVIVRTH